MKVTRFLKEGFIEGSSPNVDTIKKHIKAGNIPGEQQGSTWYVWVGPNLELMQPGSSAGDILHDSILQEWLDDGHAENKAA